MTTFQKWVFWIEKYTIVAVSIGVFKVQAEPSTNAIFGLILAFASLILLNLQHIECRLCHTSINDSEWPVYVSSLIYVFLFIWGVYQISLAIP